MKIEGTQKMRDSLCPYLNTKVFNNSKTIINSNVTYIDLSSYKNIYKEIAYLFAIEYAYQQMIKNLKIGIHTFVCIP